MQYESENPVSESHLDFFPTWKHKSRPKRILHDGTKGIPDDPADNGVRFFLMSYNKTNQMH